MGGQDEPAMQSWEQCPFMRRWGAAVTQPEASRVDSRSLCSVCLRLYEPLSEPSPLARPNPANKPLTLSVSLGLICCSVLGFPRGLVASREEILLGLAAIGFSLLLPL